MARGIECSPSPHATNDAITLRVSWLPIWESSQGIKDDLIMFADVHSIAHETIDGIMTGVRIVNITVRENDIPKIPYCVRVNRHFGLVTMQGRPPKCFKCEGIGHIQSEYPYEITSVNPRNRRPVNASWANVVKYGPSSGPPAGEWRGHRHVLQAAAYLPGAGLIV